MSDRSNFSPAVRSILVDTENREPRDFYPTPAGATMALLRHEKFGPTIWEPACGDGEISKVLEAHGHKVWSSDIADYGYGGVGDFFETGPYLDGEIFGFPDAIITNPPFKFAQRFVERALSFDVEAVAMFGRLQFLESRGRKALFETTPFAKCLVFSDRVPMWRATVDTGRVGGKMQAFAWFIWRRGWTGPPVIEWCLFDAESDFGET